MPPYLKTVAPRQRNGRGAASEELRRKIDNWDSKPQPNTTLADLRQQLRGALAALTGRCRRVRVADEHPGATDRGSAESAAGEHDLLSYFVTPLSAHAWILDKKTLEHVRLNMDEPDLRPSAAGRSSFQAVRRAAGRMRRERHARRADELSSLIDRKRVREIDRIIDCIGNDFEIAIFHEGSHSDEDGHRLCGIETGAGLGLSSS
jgi:hypothetical protein